jgi:protease-4
VAGGRKLPVERVREIAKGRVWTGAQAKELGLVDHVGGFNVALAQAAKLGGLDPKTVRLKTVSVRKSPFDALRGAVGASAESVALLNQVAWLLSDPAARSLLDDAARARMGVGASTLRAPVPAQ